VADELKRVVQRWQQLPLDHALRCVPVVRDVLARHTPHGLPEVPDLGPAVVMDQLTVLVFDACRDGRATGLQEELAALRRSLA
jgi:hypothetical protein